MRAYQFVGMLIRDDGSDNGDAQDDERRGDLYEPVASGARRDADSRGAGLQGHDGSGLHRRGPRRAPAPDAWWTLICG